MLHLHQTIDLVTQFFPQGSKEYSRTNRAIRLALIETAVQEKLPGLIFTYGYGNPTPNMDTFIKTVIHMVQTYGDQTFFVYLWADQDTLRNRVTQQSRKNTGKIKTAEELAKALRERTFGKIEFVENLVIDTTKLSAETVAQQILNHYKP